MKIDRLHILSIAAALALAAGIGWTALSLRQAPVMERRLKSRAAVLDELQDLRRTRDRYAAAVRTLEALSNAAPVSLAGLATATMPSAVPDIRELETRALERGWMLTRSEVIFNDIRLNQLPAFLSAAESRRPPWRLTECAITASTRADGCGRVALEMESLSKQTK